MKDEKDRKIFVGGLGSKVKSEHLRGFFAKFGEIHEVRMIKDPKTKQSKGYAFVLFKDKATVLQVIKYKEEKKKNIKINGVPVDIKLTQTREEKFKPKTTKKQNPPTQAVPPYQPKNVSVKGYTPAQSITSLPMDSMKQSILQQFQFQNKLISESQKSTDISQSTSEAQSTRQEKQYEYNQSIEQLADDYWSSRGRRTEISTNFQTVNDIIDFKSTLGIEDQEEMESKHKDVLQLLDEDESNRYDTSGLEDTRMINDCSMYPNTNKNKNNVLGTTLNPENTLEEIFLEESFFTQTNKTKVGNKESSENNRSLIDVNFMKRAKGKGFDKIQEEGQEEQVGVLAKERRQNTTTVQDLEQYNVFEDSFNEWILPGLPKQKKE